MIPKIIHYCWFGRNPLPKDAKRCIASWRKHLPDYEIKEWNEDNFDIDVCSYVREAYDARKYAFVSDFARFYILYRYGGVYFDTDVEVVKPMQHIIDAGNFMAIEQSLATNGNDPTLPIGVAPGLGIGAEAAAPLFKEILDYYANIHFDINDGTVVIHTTGILNRHGLKNENTLQHVAGFTIYPADYFCPMDSTTGIVTLTDNTVSIHHYSCSWMDHNTLGWRIHQLKNAMIRVLGPKTVLRLAKMLKG